MSDRPDLRDVVDHRDVVKAWNAAYFDWEIGKLPSPSADDLARIAGEVIGIRVGWDLAEAIYDRLCDGDDLADIAEALF